MLSPLLRFVEKMHATCNCSDSSYQQETQEQPDFKPIVRDMSSIEFVPCKYIGDFEKNTEYDKSGAENLFKIHILPPQFFAFYQGQAGDARTKTDLIRNELRVHVYAENLCRRLNIRGFNGI